MYLDASSPAHFMVAADVSPVPCPPAPLIAAEVVSVARCAFGAASPLWPTAAAMLRWWDKCAAPQTPSPCTHRTPPTAAAVPPAPWHATPRSASASWRSVPALSAAN